MFAYLFSLLVLIGLLLSTILAEDNLRYVKQPVPTQKRYHEGIMTHDAPPMPPIAERAANITRYLHTLHNRLKQLAAPDVDPAVVW